MQSSEERFIKFAQDHRRYTSEGGASQINKSYEGMIIALNELRKTSDRGVSFLKSVALGNDPGVAAWAALYLFPYDSNLAISVLEKIASSDIPRLSFTTRMTLQELRSGRLVVE